MIKMKLVPYIGQRIIGIRKMSKAELDREGWDVDNYNETVVIVLENGIVLFASSDEEGNGPGCIFGYDKTGAFSVACQDGKE